MTYTYFTLDKEYIKNINKKDYPYVILNENGEEIECCASEKIAIEYKNTLEEEYKKYNLSDNLTIIKQVVFSYIN